MKILVAPLNWGLGHASRCIPIVQRLLDEGNEVVLGGDGDSLTLLRKHFPTLRNTYLAPLNLRYSAGKSQVWAVIRLLPQLWAWAVKDHAMLSAVLREEQFDQIISDNRFGLYLNQQSAISNQQCECIYITHQLNIRLPHGWRWLEPLVARLHARIYTRYNKVWVPDRRGSGTEYPPRDTLAGELSHKKDLRLDDLRCTIEYIGPQSRFGLLNLSNQNSQNNPKYDIVAVLSGLEPQRSLLEHEIVTRYAGKEEQVLIVQGLPGRPNTRFSRKNITTVPHLNDTELAFALLGAKHIIARSGYSTIMDLEALGLLQSQITNHKL